MYDIGKLMRENWENGVVIGFSGGFVLGMIFILVIGAEIYFLR